MLENDTVINFHRDCTSSEHIQEALETGELINIKVWRLI